MLKKNRIDTNLEDAKKYIDQHTEIKQLSLDLSLIVKAFEIDDIPELHDRLITAFAKKLNIQILSNDPMIRTSKHVEAIWD